MHRSLLNVMLCNMYRGVRGGSRLALTTYCDAHHIVPHLSTVVGPDIAQDDQIRALNQMLPRSVLPCALALACAACEKRWPEVVRSEGRIFGPGCSMPDWIRRVVCGRTRFVGRSVVLKELMSPGTCILGARGTREEWLARATPETTGLLVAATNLDELWVVRGEVTRLLFWLFAVPLRRVIRVTLSRPTGRGRDLSIRSGLRRSPASGTRRTGARQCRTKLEWTQIPPV